MRMLCIGQHSADYMTLTVSIESVRITELRLGDKLWCSSCQHDSPASILCNTSGNTARSKSNYVVCISDFRSMMYRSKVAHGSQSNIYIRTCYNDMT